jgi:hypothetical protein
MKHEIELTTETYESIQLNLQRALFRRDVEHVDAGDVLVLKERNRSGEVTGRWQNARVTHVQRSTLTWLNAPEQVAMISFTLMSAGCQADKCESFLDAVLMSA